MSKVSRKTGRKSVGDTERRDKKHDDDDVDVMGKPQTNQEERLPLRSDGAQQKVERPSHWCTTKDLLQSKHMLKVHLGVNVVSMFDVDTVREMFKVRLVVRCVWPVANEPFVSGLNSVDDVMHLVNGVNDADVDWEPKWFPRFGIRNKEESTEVVENFVSVLVNKQHPETEDQWRAAIETKLITKNDFWILRRTSMNVTINQSEKLTHFPFDLQELKIIIRMEHPSTQVEVEKMDFLPEDVFRSFPRSVCIPTNSVNVNFENLDTAERFAWRRLPCAIKLSNDVTNRAMAFDCGALQLSIFVERHVGYYVSNVLLMVFLITTLTSVSWSILPSDIADRLALDSTLLLTGQALKLVISDKLPKVNYLTYIDIYIFWCFIFIIFGMVLHARAGWQSDADQDLDDTCMWIWSASWLGSNVIFVMLMVCARVTDRNTIINRVKQEQFEVFREDEVGLGNGSKRLTGTDNQQKFPSKPSRDMLR